MRTKTIFTTLISLSLVIFMVSTGISSPAKKNTDDILKKTEKDITTNNVSKTSMNSTSSEEARDLSYLRFDVNDYAAESAETELPVNNFDYLRFDVNAFVVANESEITELPFMHELDYLRFDVNNFTENHTDSPDEMPLNEFDYLRFDVNNFISASNNATEELPLTE